MSKKRQGDNSKLEESERQVTELKTMLRKKEGKLEEVNDEYSKLKESYDHLKSQLSETTYITN